MDIEQRNLYENFQCQLEIQLLSLWHWRRDNMQHARKVWPVAKLQGLRLVVLRLLTHHPFDSGSFSTIIKLFPWLFVEPHVSWSHCLQQVPVTYSTEPGCSLASAQHLPIPQTQSSPWPCTQGDLQTDSSTGWAAQYRLPALRNLFSSVLGLSALVVTWWGWCHQYRLRICLSTLYICSFPFQLSQSTSVGPARQRERLCVLHVELCWLYKRWEMKNPREA